MTSEDVQVNNGERLYYQNLAHGFLRESKLEETKKNEEDNYTMEFNFKPRIPKMKMINMPMFPVDSTVNPSPSKNMKKKMKPKKTKKLSLKKK